MAVTYWVEKRREVTSVSYFPFRTRSEACKSDLKCGILPTICRVFAREAALDKVTSLFTEGSGFFWSYFIYRWPPLFNYIFLSCEYFYCVWCIAVFLTYIFPPQQIGNIFLFLTECNLSVFKIYSCSHFNCTQKTNKTKTKLSCTVSKSECVCVMCVLPLNSIFVAWLLTVVFAQRFMRMWKFQFNTTTEILPLPLFQLISKP